MENKSLTSVETVLNSTEPSTLVVQFLLALVRASLKHSGPNRNGTFKVSRAEKSKDSLSSEMRETRLRNEVRDMPSKFIFGPQDLVTYHPIHLAEIISILLAVLLVQGIDGRNKNTGPELPGELMFAKPGEPTKPV